MKKLAWAIVASGLFASSASATPRRIPNYLFASFDECTALVSVLWRGNHAFYCEMGPDGWYIAYDPAYEANRKGPKPK